MLFVALSTTVALSVITLCAVFYRKRKQHMTLFKRLGIAGPSPHWLTGNSNDLYYDVNEEPHDVYQRWTSMYGETYGYFEGSTPHIVTSDPDLIQEILVKNFSKFSGRKIFSFMTQKHRDEGHIVFANGARWRRLRYIINPTFSAAKLKLMVPTLIRKVENLENNLAAASDNPVEVLEYFQRLTLATIGNVAFGLNFDPQNNPDDEYLRTCRALFDAMSPKNKPFFMRVVDALPELRRMFGVFINAIIQLSPVNGYFSWIGRHLDKVIEERRNETNDNCRRSDLLQLMLDAEVESLPNSESGELADDDSSAMKHNRKSLTTQELRQQAIIFMAAGYETTSSTLSFVVQMLALNPEKQVPLLQELDTVAPDKVPLSYTDVQNMTYLDMVICETLRLYPPSTMAVTRECFEECSIKGIPFSPGTVVQVDVWSVHRRRDIWGADAEEFIPERFASEERRQRHPMAWLAFGAGPKNCLGQKFALMEIKFALCHLLQRYKFERCAQTEDPLILRNNLATSPRNGVHVRLVRRQ